jgi:hypothetical protein
MEEVPLMEDQAFGKKHKYHGHMNLNFEYEKLLMNMRLRDMP